MKYQFVIFSLSCVLYLIRYIINVFFANNKSVQKYIITTLQQYTFWNLCLIVINALYKNQNFEIFIFINTTVIFITYYIFHFTYRDKIKSFPNISPKLNEFDIEVAMFLAHGLPFIYYLYKIAKMTYTSKVFSNIGFESSLFNIIWTLSCFYSFDPTPAYFDIPIDILHLVWIFMILLHIVIGYLVTLWFA